MLRLRHIFLLAAILLCTMPVFAQQLPCTTSDVNAYQEAHDPAFAQSLQRQLHSWTKYNQQISGFPQGLIVSTSSGPVYEIPIVFHIIHTGQAVGTAMNPSDATIQSLVSYLNAVYAATWASNPDTNSGGVYVPIRFVLAQRSPTCQATTGINRVNGSSVTGYAAYGLKQPGASQGGDEVTVKALSIWPNTAYLNIWIVTNIQGAAANGGAVAGYAYYPGAAANIDGVVLRYDQTSWAIAHEVGHTLGLRHTFEGSSTSTACPTNNNCVTDGDLVCDTDPHPLVSGCPTGTNPCTGTSYVPVVYNIMNYSSCPNRFSAGQKTRMIYQLLNYRHSWLTSLGGLAPGTYPTNIAAPPAACIPSAITNSGNPYSVGPTNVFLADLGYYSGGYSDDGAFYLDHTVNSCMQGQQIAHLTTGSAYTLSVTAGPYNAENSAAWIDWNNDGTFQATEKILSVADTGAGQTATVTFIVPTGAVTCTPLRMRVFSDFVGSAAPTACGNPAYGQVEDFTVYVQPATATPAVSISASATTVCAGTSVTYTATPVNAGSAPVCQWKKNGVNAGTGGLTFTYTPANGDSVRCVLTASTGCSGTTDVSSNMINMVVNPTVTPAVSVAASANNICAGTSVTFTATPTNGGAAPAYQWKVNGINAGTGISTYTYTPANGDVITCVLTSNASCAVTTTATSSQITMTVNPTVTPSVSIAASANNICAGTSVTFTATPTSGGTAPVYQWKVNGTNAGTGTATYTYTPANGDVITCVLTSNASCTTTNTATSSAITMIVNPTVTPSISVSASANNICAGMSVTFTATPTNGGTASIYQWKVSGTNAGTGTAIYAYTPANGDVVTCVLTSNASCTTTNTATSSAIAMVVNPTVTPAVSISASANNVCAGTSVIFTATPINGGTLPIYQWKVNGTNVGTGTATYTYAPVNGDAISCTLTSSETCASPATITGNTLTTIINPLVIPAISMTVNPGSNVNTGQSVTFTATVTNGGSNPAIAWFRNNIQVPGISGIAWTAVAGTDFHGNDIITASLHSGESCAQPDTARSSNIVMQVSNVGVTTISTPDGFRFYPNPTESGITLEGLHKGDKATLHDVTGKMIAAYTSSGSSKETWQLGDIASGVYFVECSRADNSIRWEIKLIRR